MNGAFIIILMIFFFFFGCYTFDSLFKYPLHLKTMLRHSLAAAAPLRVIGPQKATCGFFF